MSSHTALNGRLVRVEKKAPQPEKRETTPLTLALFSGDEQANIDMLWAIFEHDFTYLCRLNEEQLEYVGLVCKVHEIADNESEQAAKYHRQMAGLAASPHFSQRLESLVEQFLAIDESVLPEYEEIPSRLLNYGTIPPPHYFLRRARYRERKAWIERQIATGVMVNGERMRNMHSYEDEMRKWVDAYGQEESEPGQ